jgi:hypothetical protein
LNLLPIMRLYLEKVSSTLSVIDKMSSDRHYKI